MTDVASCIGRIPPEPDVSGIGIRVSVYVTTILLSLLPRIPETEDLTSALSSAAGLQATALTVTALVKTRSNELSLYHALIIFHLLFFLGINVDHMGPITGSMFRVTLHLVGAWIALVLFLAWALHLWLTAPAFGPDDFQGCNDLIKYPIFFKDVRATVPWLRWLFVTVASLGLFFLVFIPFVTTIVWIAFKTFTRSRPEAATETKDKSSREDSLSDRTAALRFLAAIYSVVMLELTVRRNADLVEDDAETKWGFGQIAAMVILLSTVNEILHALISLLFYEGETGARRNAFGRAFARITPFSSYWLSIFRRNKGTDNGAVQATG